MKPATKRRKKAKKNTQSRSRLIWVILLIILLIPILYGVYLYFQQPRQTESPITPAPQEKTLTPPQQEESGKKPNRPNDTKPGKPSKRPANRPDGSQAVVTFQDLDRPICLRSPQEQVITHRGYTVSYNKNWRIPNWVSYELTRKETKGKEKRYSQFIPDPLVRGIQATNADYVRSGYDKGHMAPAADMKWSSTVMKESFYFSNMCPQHPQLNRRGWKDLEEKIRDWAITDSAIVVICGPIVDKHAKTIGKNQVTVPKQFFKVILSPYRKPMRAIGFLFKNQQAVEPLSTYAVSVDYIEQLTQMDFFAPLPDSIENKIEAECNYRSWR